MEKGCGVTDAHVLECLRRWRFHRNRVRTNVMRQCQDWVYSDTLGVVHSRDGRLCLSRTTKENPSFMALLCAWIRDVRPLKDPFPFTSVPLDIARL